MKEDNKYSFNENPINYDNMRPNYPVDLFHDIFKFSNLNKNRKLLEIGIGTGQATLPFINLGCNLVAVEIGKNLSDFTREKFKQFSNFSIINIDFKDFVENDNIFDLVYSASAFHWIPKDIGYPKVLKILKNKGVLALFWNHPVPDTIVQKIYDKYQPESQKSKRLIIDNEHCQGIINNLKIFGFKEIESKLFFEERIFNSNQYISLMNTYSGHKNMEQSIKKNLEKKYMKQ